MRPHRWQPTRLPHPWDSPGKNTGVGCHFLLQCMRVKSESEVTQLCPTLSDPMDCSPPGSSIHGIFQARVLEWGAISFSVKLRRPKSQMLFFSLTLHTQSATESYWLFFQNVFIVYLKFRCNWNTYFYLHSLPTLPTNPFLTCAPCYLLPSSLQPSLCLLQSSHTDLAIFLSTGSSHLWLCLGCCPFSICISSKSSF